MPGEGGPAWCRSSTLTLAGMARVLAWPSPRFLGGVIAQRRHSTNYYAAYPRNTPENHPPTEGCMINSKQHGVHNSRPWDCSKHHTSKTKIPGVPAGAAGCRIQDPGTRGYRWWKTADFSHSARCAPLGQVQSADVMRAWGEEDEREWVVALCYCYYGAKAVTQVAC